MPRIPYVIDNDQQKLAAVLNQVLENHADLAMDVATAFVAIRGYQLSASSSRNGDGIRGRESLFCSHKRACPDVSLSGD